MGASTIEVIIEIKWPYRGQEKCRKASKARSFPGAQKAEAMKWRKATGLWSREVIEDTMVL